MKANTFSNIKNILGWTRSSYYLMSVFIAIVGLIIIVWWPLAEEYFEYFDERYPIWIQLDRLLIGIFLAMSLLIMAGADIRADMWIVMVGLVGGLVIESWGTQTNLWVYYTNERPPLWIIPAWPIASLSIDRLVRIVHNTLPQKIPANVFKITYWIIFPAFYALMLIFVMPTIDKSLTIMSLLLVLFLILTPTDYRLAVITFLAGSALGYFLERWGTTRLCWTYYTHQTPPFFAVVAHGLAAVAFWRSMLVMKKVLVGRRGFWAKRGLRGGRGVIGMGKEGTG